MTSMKEAAQITLVSRELPWKIIKKKTPLHSNSNGEAKNMNDSKYW